MCGTFRNKIDWFDQECKNLRNSILDCDNIQERFMLRREYKALVQRKKRLSKISKMQELDQSSGKDSKRFWNLIKSFDNQNTLSNLDPQIICNQIASLSSMPEEPYFNKKFEKECIEFLDQYENDLSFNNWSNMDDSILNSNFTIDEIKEAINHLKCKSPGLDRIPSQCIKGARDILVHHLCTLYNYILCKGQYPNEWAYGLRVAIPKGKDDIRPITIEPMFGKLFESIVDKRLSFYKEIFDKEDKYNGGFLKNSRTQDNMLILLGCIQKQLALNQTLYVGYIDFKKAFNYVNKNVLFYKLIKGGIKGRIILLLRNMYSKIKAQVKVQNKLYRWITDSCGTNQGGPLSPNMFRQLLQDLSCYLDSKRGIVLNANQILLHLLWADDLILLSDTEEGLQRQLDGVFQFCSKSQMIVNSLKTKVMVFGKKSDVSFKFHETPLSIVEEYKFLGVVFNTVVKYNQNVFKQHVTYTKDKALKSTFMCFKKLGKLGMITPKVGFQLFDSYVKPIVNYACEIWSTTEYPTLESVQTKFLKMLLGVKSSTCNMAMYAETGRYPLHLQHKINCIKYWCRLTRLTDDKIVKQMYNMPRELSDLGFKTWCNQVYSILSDHGFSHFYNENVV